MGYRDATGWHELEQTNAQLKPDTDYHLLLALNGTTATLVLDGSDVFTHILEARVEDGYASASMPAWSAWVLTTQLPGLTT
jgi:hypothetical protein